MEKLINKLGSNLTQNPEVVIQRSDVWQLAVVSYGVTYDRVKRLKMDILMKMLLFAFQETEIRRAATLADMLSVEELFISDLIAKMQRTDLILLGLKGFVLTAKGYEHLEKGIFEEELESEQIRVFYSAVHDEYQLIEEDSLTAEQEFPIYRYALEKSADKRKMLELLSKEKDSSEEDFQLIITRIVDFEERASIYVPCIEFQLYDRKQDVFYARVWNTGIGQWDELLEKQIEERELVAWREAVKAEVKIEKVIKQ